MDGVVELLSLNVTISVYTDPVFFPLTSDNSSLVYDQGVNDVINITVSHTGLVLPSYRNFLSCVMEVYVTI